MRNLTFQIFFSVGGAVLFVLSGWAFAQTASPASPFAPDKMDTVLYGAAYYTEYMPYDRLEQDVQLMQQAGITVVRMGESSWGLWEPQDGRALGTQNQRQDKGSHASSVRKSDVLGADSGWSESHGAS